MIERCGDIPVYTAEFDVLTKLTGFALTRGALCAMYRPKLQETGGDLCQSQTHCSTRKCGNQPTSVLFSVRRLRFMDAVLLTPGCSDPLYRRAIRVSMGTVFQIPWTYLQTENGVKNPPGQAAGADIDHLHKMGFRVAAMALSGDSVGIDDPALAAEEKLAVVLGTEGDGLAGHTIADCDYTVCIPMSHGVDSLNVAAANAVAFWQLGRNNCTIKH